MTGWAIRFAVPADMEALAALWHATWHDSHALIVPAALAAGRTPASFAARLQGLGANLRVSGPVGAPLGLCIRYTNRIEQIYVAPSAQGTGLAHALLRDGEARLFAAGVRLAELDCAAQNHRAARFYTSEGWALRTTEMVGVETPDGEIMLPVLTFEKHLMPGGA
ncbi:MAG: GNAT family N-acetyltransferase [Albidovulum sp.]